MKILLVSNRFSPSVGGVETVTRLLGEALVRAGHQAAVVTREPNRDSLTTALAVLRRPRPLSLLRAYRQAQTVILQGPALRLAWPLLLVRRPALMVHHMPSGAGDTGLPRLLREKLGARVRHATVSRATAQQLPWPIDAILPNPYDHELFRTGLDIPRTKDIVFLGRLIPEKGLHVLIESLGILRRQGSSLSATVVGAGPESARLAELAVTGGVPAGLQVVGELTGAPLARLLNQHRVMVVPSIGDEAFGVVALEGIACGCVVVASHAGGLPEAVGPCGMTFLRGDAAGLAATLKIILSSEDTLGGFRSKAAQHLAKHLPDFVALQYLSAAFAKVRNPLERQFAIGLGS